MDVTSLQLRAQARVDDVTWGYFQGTADGDLDRDTRAWARWDFVPRVMTGMASIDTSTRIGGALFSSPVVLAPSASQGAMHPDGELATRRAAAAAGLLAGYSFHATVEVERFAAAADAPWWAQAYVLEERFISDGYLRRCAAHGASAIILTVDVPGALADAPFRRVPMSPAVAHRGNYPVDERGRAASVTTASFLTPDDIRRTADVSGLPVWVKGIMTAQDAHRALDAGAAGVFVSNHARRQLAGVAPTAAVLSAVVEGLAGRAPVIVDGGIRSGADAVRALALGAHAAAIGRPIPWALAAGGQTELEFLLSTLTDEIRVTMAALGAARVGDVVSGMVQQAVVA